jgi:putative Mg2+ transporter-C (MgtC) family protein
MNWSSDVLSIILAAVFGAAVGLERELSGKAAGLRTNILICLGAATFTILSRYMAADQDSLTRIASGIVTGIGFLGAGAIIQDRGGIHGMTTAATIWVVASIGMACGARYYRLAILTALITVAVLLVLKAADKHLEHYHIKSNLRRNSPKT